MSDEYMTTIQVKATVGNNLPILRWLLRHTADIQPIADAAVAWQAADGLTAKWSATKVLGDIIVPIAADFPTDLLMAVSEAQYEQFAVELNDAYKAHGEIIKILVDNLPAIIEAITRLWPLFSGGK